MAGGSLAPDRTDPLEILALQATTRLPDLVPIRYGRMAASAFAFFRGAAAVMAADLAHDGPRPASRSSCAGTPTCPTSAASPLPSAT